MSKNLWLGLGAVVIVAAVIWFGVATKKAPTETGPIRIGASLPLTGEAASLGEQTKAGIELAQKEINDAGGIGGRQVEVIFEDDKCAKDGADVFNKLVSLDKVAAIIGPLCSSAAGPGLPIAQANHVPTVFWASAPGLTKAGEYVFRTYPSDAFQGKFAAEYIYNTLGKHKAAVLYVNNDYGKGLSDVFAARFKELGGEVVENEGVTQTATDMRTELSKIKAADPEALYMALYPGSGVVAVKQAKAIGLSAVRFGGDALDLKEFTSVPEAEGAMYSVGKFNQPEAFATKLKQGTGTDINIYSVLGYDAFRLLASVISSVGTDSQKVRDALAAVNYTEGVALSEISFDADRDLKTAQYEVHLVHNGSAEIVK